MLLKVEKSAKCIVFAQNSLKWCAEFASYVHRIFHFLAQNSDRFLIGVCYCNVGIAVL